LDLPRIIRATKVGMPGTDMSTVVDRTSHLPGATVLSVALAAAHSSMNAAARYLIIFALALSAISSPSVRQLNLTSSLRVASRLVHHQGDPPIGEAVNCGDEAAAVCSEIHHR
jgi:hypothetical protein